jgi:hypothetical protein
LAEWLVEEGIGERRALLVEGGEVLAARLQWPGELRAGEVRGAQLVRKLAGTRRGIARLENGTEALVDHLPVTATEGTTGEVRITRAPIAERGRLKRAQARWSDGTQAEATTFAAGERVVRRFEPGLWEEVWHAASSGSIAFAGGEILCSVTPAMTLIDIDGDHGPRELALAAIPEIARALRWFDLGGNIGIDFPTLEAKADRRAVDAALDGALAHWPHERTAMNGFGFVQIVARLEGPSLLHRFATSRVGMCARYALRLAEQVEGAGVTLVTVHPALKAKIRPEWLEELRRRTGREVRIETDPALALETPHAQIVSA